jgi:hypothetical protein
MSTWNLLPVLVGGFLTLVGLFIGKRLDRRDDHRRWKRQVRYEAYLELLRATRELNGAEEWFARTWVKDMGESRDEAAASYAEHHDRWLAVVEEAEFVGTFKVLSEGIHAARKRPIMSGLLEADGRFSEVDLDKAKDEAQHGLFELSTVLREDLRLDFDLRPSLSWQMRRFVPKRWLPGNQ